jgi:hypothetical protein
MAAMVVAAAVAELAVVAIVPQALVRETASGHMAAAAGPADVAGPAVPAAAAAAAASASSL